MEKRYQIFISSTYNDLIEERKKVVQAILKLYHLPIGMEMFHADNEEQWCQIKKTIEMSDYYVVIVGRYCGTLIDGEGISYTEKEYDYANSIGIPILSFVISDEAEIKSYGVESNKQQRALKKFIKKVKKKPCEFWKNGDELAFQVSSTLSIKFQENNRKGWIRNNPYGIYMSENISDFIIGNYDLFYFSGMIGTEELIKSKLVIAQDGTVILYNNLRGVLDNAEYTYHGSCVVLENLIYIYLKNDSSEERATICFLKSVGVLNRYIGLFTAVSSNMNPVCIKIAAFKENTYKRGINKKILHSVLMHSNEMWKNNILIFEELQRHLFFSDRIYQDKIQ